MKLLTQEFLANYPDMPEHMNNLAQFVFYRTYSRWLDDEKRRETWKEAVERAVEYNVGIAVKELTKHELPFIEDKIRFEAEILYDNIFNLRQFLSGRTHWVGGAKSGVAAKFPLANFNCSFIDVTEWEDLCDLFYMLLIGTGVGFKCTKEAAKNMPPIRTNFELIHSEYKPMIPEERLEHSKLNIIGNYAKIYIGDSKEGWVEALKMFFNLLTDKEYKNITTIKLSYNSIRPKGERLKTFGGTASGYEPMKEMFEGIEATLKNTLDTSLEPIIDGHVRPIHILDMGNLIGNNVVVGGVRRTAEIFLCDKDDWESILAKYGINGVWDKERHINILNRLAQLGVAEKHDIRWLNELRLNDANARPLHHRRMSNNSIAFTEKPSEEMLDLLFTIMQSEGEPGLINLEAANKRRPNAKGLNPCAEVLLDSYGVCNLTTVNVAAFIKEKDGLSLLDFNGLMQAQALSARAGLRMTCLDLELPKWDKIQKRDRLIGTSLTGWKDAIDMLEYTEEQEVNLLNILSEVVQQETIRYSHILRIPTPLLDTTIKPEGTLSQVANGVSSGLHVSHAPYFIRRIRINANDPLCKLALRNSWTMHPEVGTPEGEEVRTWVIEFPIKSGATKTRSDQDVTEQFDTYFRFQNNYTAHNSSNTISVKPDEWKITRDIVYSNWDNFIGVSFLAYNGGTYPLSPYEEITEEEYNKRVLEMLPFNPKMLEEFEKNECLATEDGMESCESGICPIR